MKKDGPGARRRIYESIVKAYGDYGVSPTIRELVYEAKISSTSVVSYHLDVLVEDGLITKTKGEARSILVVGAIWLDPDGARDYQRMLRIEQEKYP